MTRKRSLFSRATALAAILGLSTGVLLAADAILPWGYPGSASTSGKSAADTILAGADPKIPMQLALPSPDGSWAITWPTQEQGEKLDGKLDNMLVDVKAAKPIFRIDSGKDGDYDGKRMGGLDAIWRADSRAVILFHGGYWGPRSVKVVVIGEDAKATATEVLAPVRAEILKVFKTQAAKLTKNLDAENFPIQIGCEFSPDGNALQVMALGETNPKMILGEARVVAELSATFDLASRKLAVTSGKVTEAKILKEE